MSGLITTATNFKFAQKSFKEAKTALNRERETGAIDNERLKGIGLEGASRTGKTWDISAFVCHYVTTYSGKQVNICRDHRTTLIKTFYQTFKQLWRLFNLPMSHINKTASPIHFNGNTITFVGVNDDIMIAHGLESDLLVVNEAMGIAKETADHLIQRTNEFYIFDYNPSATGSWLFDIESLPDYRIHKTNIFSNKYTPANARQKILSYAHPDVDDWEDVKHATHTNYTKEEWDAFKAKNLALGTADKFMWVVYGLGRRAKSEDIIYQNWELYAEEPKESIVEWKLYGGDFGYKNDPTAIVCVKKAGNSLYLKQLCYNTGLLNSDIANLMTDKGYVDTLSVWDSAEQKSIDELRVSNIPAAGAEKGAGSVAYGIQKVQQYKVFIHSESTEMQDEFRKYKWLKDRNGEYKRNTLGQMIPEDKNNHTLDAIRYAVTYYLQPNTNED